MHPACLRTSAENKSGHVLLKLVMKVPQDCETLIRANSCYFEQSIFWSTSVVLHMLCIAYCNMYFNFKHVLGRNYVKFYKMSSIQLVICNTGWLCTFKVWD